MALTPHGAPASFVCCTCVAACTCTQSCWPHRCNRQVACPLSVPCSPHFLPQLVGQDPGRFEDAEGDEFEEFEQQQAAAAGGSERQPNGGC